VNRTKTKREQNGLSVVDKSTVLAIPRAQAPDELNDEEAAEWRAVTNRMPADYFGREHYPTLVQLCRHTIAARRIAQLIEQHLGGEEINPLVYIKLLRAQKEETTAIVLCERTMRLTHQSNVPANVSRTPPVTVDAPWTAY
jgi:hypothetical protein